MIDRGASSTLRRPSTPSSSHSLRSRRIFVRISGERVQRLVRPFVQMLLPHEKVVRQTCVKHRWKTRGWRIQPEKSIHVQGPSETHPHDDLASFYPDDLIIKRCICHLVEIGKIIQNMYQGMRPVRHRLNQQANAVSNVSQSQDEIGYSISAGPSGAIPSTSTSLTSKPRLTHA